MGHDKLRKFAENETFTCLLQPSSAEILADGYFSLRDHKIKGRWNAEMFDAPRPIVLELGCGKGEYTIALAERDPSRNYIGVDIKGARLWKGAKYAETHHLGNVAFLRTRIELINAFFAPGEVDEIWLTFSDPQIRRENARLSSPLFLERYTRLLRPGGIIHLKTDSRFLYQYTKAVCQQNGLEIIACTTDLYGEGAISAKPAAESLPENSVAESLSDAGAVQTGAVDVLSDDGAMPIGAVDVLSDEGAMPTDPASIPLEAREVQTFYETIFRSQGYRINYIAFRLGAADASVSGTSAGSLFQSPDRELFNPEYWRSIEGERQIFGHDTAETRRQKLKKESSRKLK
ncbi:MAG: tRNA (guanosine(46)-N7)-methyltransferase TrmB [Candidatus Cryptobacteroides sp.]|nr:tRNA (guanosine(46)-N7)-methyltransferase TrmB [Candidatus Cryptobacteroides sp.]